MVFHPSFLNMKLLSLDQATKTTGYAVFEDKKLIDFGALKSLGKNSDSRFKEMCEYIRSAIESSGIDLVVFEDVSLRSSVQILISLSRLQGAIIQICNENNIPFCISSPSHWRKIIGINDGAGTKRKELKTRAVEYVLKYHKVKVIDDIAEAICIGTAYMEEKEQTE